MWFTFILAYGTNKQGILGPREPVTPSFPGWVGEDEKILRTDTQFLKIATNQLPEEKPVALILRNYMKLSFSSLAWSFSEETIGLSLFPSTTGAASSRGSPRGFAPQNRGLPVHEFLAFQIAPSDKRS